jgi:aubergine-like protein
MRVNATRPTDRRIVEITIRLVGQVAQVDSMTLHFYNIVVRKCLESLKLEEMGRHFFDRMAAVKLPNLRLELWPGFVTSMRHHENEVLLCVEPIHKVLRTDSVLTIILHHQGKTPLDYKVHIRVGSEFEILKIRFTDSVA